MTTTQLSTVLNAIQDIPQSDELAAALLRVVADSAALRARKKSPEPLGEPKTNYFKLTKQEIEKMPKDAQRFFIFEEQEVYYRETRGFYQARYHRNGYHIEVASKDFKTMKKKFVLEFIRQTENKNQSKAPYMRDFAIEWLAFKKPTIKESTYKSYENLVNSEIIKKLGDKRLDELTRKDIQAYLNDLVEADNKRTAQKVKQMLSAMYDIAAEDYGIKSPMTRIVLPHYETEKGTPLSIAEEKLLVDYCLANPHLKASSALLLLVYTGMRVGELKTAAIYDNYVECETEKIRKGYAAVRRKIPISPMLKRVIKLIDLEKSKSCSKKYISDILKKVFPDRHTHELRYTFISRCKEYGCNLELVMLWDGHSFDKDVASSKVDRGYTRYSDEFYFKEIEKVNYEL